MSAEGRAEKVDLARHLSDHFALGELLRSETAERRPELYAAQMSPPREVVTNLEHLVVATLEPIRRGIGLPLRVTSGYRSPALNRAVGGARKSQHLTGEAADLHLLPGEALPALTRKVAQAVREVCGREMRADVARDFLLFAWIALRLDELDVDQLIHEYGSGPGRPAWVHVSASKGRDRRQILLIDRRGTRQLSLVEALGLGA